MSLAEDLRRIANEKHEALFKRRCKVLETKLRTLRAWALACAKRGHGGFTVRFDDPRMLADCRHRLKVDGFKVEDVDTTSLEIVWEATLWLNSDKHVI